MPLTAEDPERIGEYVLIDRLGSGGMGTVYLAGSASGRRVALKVMHQHVGEDDEFRVRFRQEVAAARRVSGAFTAAVVDADPEAARPWMAISYIEGPTLSRLVEGQGPLRGRELRRLAIGLAEALRDIHRVGVVHRDLKPANIVLSQEGPYVIDFGISRAADNQNLTITGRVMGTPRFMSPEQLQTPRDVGPASDVFSLATVLVYAATGQGPFDADSPYITAYQVVQTAPVLDGVPAALREVIGPCLAKRPEERPHTDALLKRLHALPEGDAPGGALPDPAPDPAPAPASAPVSAKPGRRGVLSIAAVALAVVAAAGGAVMVLRADGGAEPDGATRPRTALDGKAPAGWKPWRIKPFGDSLTGGDLQCRAGRDSLYCGGDDSPAMRIRLSDGRSMWGKTPFDPLRGRTEEILGVTERTVVVSRAEEPKRTADGTPAAEQQVRYSIVGRDARSGKQLWSVRDRSDAGVVVGGTTVLQAGPGGKGPLQARHADSGKALWTFRPPADALGKGGGQALCEPRAAGARLYVICTGPEWPEGPTAVYALDGKGRARWTYKDGERHLEFLSADGSSPVLGGLTEAAGGADMWAYVVRLDAADGERLSFGLRQPYASEAAAADGSLYFTREDGRMFAYPLRSGKPRWNRLIDHDGLSSPIAAGGMLLASTPIGQVVALDPRDGRELWATRRHAEDGGAGSRGRPRVHAIGRILYVEGGGPVLFSVDVGRPPEQPRPA